MGFQVFLLNKLDLKIAKLLCIYWQSLIKLPAKISQSDLVLDFFEPTNEDIAAMEPETEQYVYYNWY